MTSWAYERYRTPLADLFSEEQHLRLALNVEAALSESLAEIGIIPEEAAREISEICSSGKITLKRVKEIESEIHHDLMAIVKAISEKCPDYGSYVHLGATSMDIQDTVLGLQLQESKKHLIQQSKTLQETLAEKTRKYRDKPCVGRTHGQHAIPVTLGFKFANHLHELFVATNSLIEADVAYGKFSGAVGTYASLETDAVEISTLKKLGLRSLPIVTQVIPRVIHARFLCSLALLAASLERLAKEVRNLQRTEIREWQEPFKEKQVGSSAMPHKRNPFRSERICGLSRVIRSNIQSYLESIALEHERDITNSSLERVIIPQTVVLTDFILMEMQYIISNLKIDLQSIEKNLHLSEGRICTERLITELANSIGRQNAHKLLNKLSDAPDFQLAVKNDPKIKKELSEDKIEELLNPETYIGLATQRIDMVLDLLED